VIDNRKIDKLFSNYFNYMLAELPLFFQAFINDI